MNKNRFAVSVKGVLMHNDYCLLRKNERQEYELLGGRLEKNDLSAERRLSIEFIEESGVKIEVVKNLEPWLYEIGLRNIIIVPYECKALDIPQLLVDEDGGTLHWIHKDEISGLYMPQGYKDTIKASVPHKSYSFFPKKFFKPTPNFVDREYYVRVHVTKNNEEILSELLIHHISPRDFISSKLGELYNGEELKSLPITIDRSNDTIIINYTIEI